MEEIQDHCYLLEKWSTNKDHSKAERVIVCEVAEVPRVTSKQLKACLTLANVNVNEPSIRRTQSKKLSWVNTEQSCKKKATVLQKENSLLKIMWTIQRTIGESLMDGKTNIERIGLNEKLLCSEKRTNRIWA